MKLLLDTHIWIWSVAEPERLSSGVRTELESPDNEIWLSPISPSLPRLAVVLRIWAVFGECEACNLLIIKDRVLPETNVVP